VNVAVLPTNRPAHLVAFLDAWDPWPWDRLIVVEDAPAVTVALPRDRWTSDVADVEVVCWADIDRELPEPWIISRGDSAVRAFGFWRAWRQGADCIVTLDDDCYPAGDDLVAEHRRNLYETPAWDSSVPGLRVRGLPYRNLGGPLPVAASVGLWLGSPDLDAVQSLAHDSVAAAANLISAARSRVMASEQYFPISGMNLAVRRESACLMYYPRMGQGSPYGRFDDIWCGLTLQRICRHLRRPIVCGRPFVDHQRASDPLANLAKEASGIGANERMWEIVDAVTLRADTPLACMRELGTQVAAHTGDGDYVQEWGRAALAWCDLFDEEP
jgi:reversibly glycosylated polypeptide/UDP-arabinopyranose mutase